MPGWVFIVSTRFFGSINGSKKSAKISLEYVLIVDLEEILDIYICGNYFASMVSNVPQNQKLLILYHYNAKLFVPGILYC